jgi:putative chitinase
MKIFEVTQPSNDLDEGWKDLAVAGIIGLGSLSPIKTATLSHDRPPVTVRQQETFKPISINPKVEKALHAIAKQSGIVGTELAQFLAQVKHESWDFSKMVEKVSGKKYDKKHDPRIAKKLGNIKVGDGERYKGRGFIGLTGRYNYDQAGKALSLPLVKEPELAANPAIAAKIAIWYWKTKVQPYVDDFNNTSEVTKKINPGLKGLQDRQQNFQAYKEVIQ